MNNKDTQYFDKEILIKIRTTLNLTQGELAKRIGVSRGCISAIEIGRNKLYDKLLKKIYSTFNIDPDSFKNGNELLFLNNSPIENCLMTEYHLTKQKAATTSRILSLSLLPMPIPTLCGIWSLQITMQMCLAK